MDAKAIVSNRYVQMVVVALVIFAGGYGTALLTRPTKVVEKDVIHEVKVVDEELVQKRVNEYVTTHKDNYTVVKVIDRKVLVPCPSAPAPSGGCKPPCATDCSKCPTKVIDEHETDTEHHHDTGSSTGTDTTNTHDVVHETDTKDETKTKVTTYSKPQWMVWGSAGINGKAFSGSNVSGPLVWGAEIDRRLVGPVWIGLSGNNALVFQLKAGLEF